MKNKASRPWSVAVACAVSLILCAWDLVWALSGESIEDMPYLEPLLVASNLIPVAFTVAAYLGLRWGRIGLLVVTALGLLAWPVVALLDGGEWVQEIDVEAMLYSAAALAVIVLLMLPSSGTWYRRVRAPVEA